jgi:long-chain fatty acid transport protein
MMKSKDKNKAQLARVRPKLGWSLGNGLVLLTAVLCCLGYTSTALGSGFALMQQGTAAMAQGNAFVADASDPTAIFYNPAGISQLNRPEVHFTGVFMHPDRDFSSNLGGSSQTNHRIYKSMGLYIAGPVNNWLSLGLGFFNPFGLGSVWPPEWEGRYITTYTSLKTYNLNPVISVKPLPNLSFAAGFNALWSAVDLKKKALNPFNPPSDAESYLNGTGMGVGYNLGVLYEPVTGVRLGAAYRSEVSVLHRGEMTTQLRLPSGALAPIPPNPARANVTFPPHVTFGINYSRLRPWSFEFDATWMGWSTYDQLRVNLSNPISPGVTSITIPKNWNDSWAFRFGTNYEVWSGFKLRAGYIFDMTPVPSSTLDPQLPDSNRHVFSVGADYRWNRFTFGFAYTYILLEPRTKSSAVMVNNVPLPLTQQANGRYSSDLHSLAFSTGFRF